ncbi:MAG: ABC transporter ATP-binding protein [Candidatus Omnitrophota bacterium]
MNNLLNISEIWAGYKKEPVIKDISFATNEGDFIGIIGPNGCGKSTLLKTISRVLTPQKGKILLNNTPIQKIHLKEFCRNIAFVPQDTLINFSFSVWEIVLMGRIPYLNRLQAESKEDFSIAMESLRLTDTLKLKDKLIDELSAGERQRVIIAKALAQQPRLLLLDEPTSHLDIGHQIQIMDLLKKLNIKNKLSIIIVMHDLNLAGLYCNRILLMNNGAIFKQGDPFQVLNYQNIEGVYKTVVVVNNNPITKKPYVVLVPKDTYAN